MKIRVSVVQIRPRAPFQPENFDFPLTVGPYDFSIFVIIVASIRKILFEKPARDWPPDVAHRLGALVSDIIVLFNHPNEFIGVVTEGVFWRTASIKHITARIN